ncbi:hypothetical protein D3C72_1824940 [compost metagenome]
MAPLIQQVIGHQALHRRFDRVVTGEGGDIVGEGVLGNADTNQFQSILQVRWS